MAIKTHTPWNKNRIIGQKKPLQISHIWGIRIRLELEGRTRDPALFNLGLDVDFNHIRKVAQIMMSPPKKRGRPKKEQDL